MIINPYTTNGNFAWHSLSICQRSLTLVITFHPLMVAQPHIQIYKGGANQAQRDSSIQKKEGQNQPTELKQLREFRESYTS